MKHSQLDAMLAESGFDPDDVEQLAAVLGPLGELADAAPEPSAELLALLGGPSDDESSEAARVVPIGGARNRGVVAGALVLALAGVGATGLSAAANTLPSPLQHQVSDFSRHYLPFDFPQPTVRIPHLATRPAAQTAEPGSGGSDGPSGSFDVRNAQEISRSLTSARPSAKAAPAWAGRPHRHGDGSAGVSTYTVPRGAGPSASASPSPTPSPSPTVKPNVVKGGAGKPSPAVPGKTASPHSTHNTGRPGPSLGPRPTHVPGSPAKGGPATDTGSAPAPPPAAGTPAPSDPLPDLPSIGVPVEGGPAVDRVTPDSGSDGSDS